MSKNPFYNALGAIAYIIVIVFSINLIDELETNVGIQQYLMPIVMLSLFTLSAAIMAYLFCYQPVLLLIDGKKEKAVSLFLKTVGIFASFILLLVLLYLLFF
jgi:hypothetical protein